MEEGCPVGYTFVQGYTKKDGTEVHGYCKIGDPSQSTVRLKATKGELTHYGYHARLPDEERHRILDEASKDLGTVRVLRHLNVRAIQNKNRNPEISEIMRSDVEYLSLKHRQEK